MQRKAAVGWRVKHAHAVGSQWGFEKLWISTEASMEEAGKKLSPQKRMKITEITEEREMKGHHKDREKE